MVIEPFLEHLEHERRYSAHTISNYRRDLTQLQAFVQSRYGDLKLTALQAQHLKQWMMGLIEGGLSARSVRRKLSAVRSMFRFYKEVGTMTQDPTALLEPPKMASRLPEFVDQKRMASLFDELKFPEGYEGLLHRTILELLYNTGMRLAELLSLTWEEVDLPGRSLRVTGKRNKQRQIPMSDRLYDTLDLFAQASGAPHAGGLLCKENGTGISRRFVQRLVDLYLGQVTTQQKRSPHVLRHTFATHMLENGADLNAVKELLGHADLSATQVYTHNTVEKLKRVHGQAHPRGKDK